MSARIDPIDVVVSDDSLIAIAILELDGNDRLPNTFGDRAFYYRIRQQPRGPDSRVGVEVNEWLLKLLTGRSGTGDLASVDAFCRLILADGLAAQGLFPHTPSGVGAHHINGRAYSELPQREEADDGTVFAYLAGKMYWGWSFGMSEVSFGEADRLRFGLPPSQISRIALAGEGLYWDRVKKTPPTFTPKSLLLQEVPAGRFPGLERSPLVAIHGRLDAPRYASVKEHIDSARNDLSRAPDNAVKEAVMAVESLALLILREKSGTLGDSIKRLQAKGVLPKPLDKTLSSIWGYASEEPGVRHGKPVPSTITEGLATYVVNIAIAALLYLLEHDSAG